jgi:hypothetical protein
MLARDAVDLSLVRKILAYPNNTLSLKEIAKKCQCTVQDVRIVFWHEKAYRDTVERAGLRIEPITKPKPPKKSKDKDKPSRRRLMLRKRYPTLEALLASKEGRTMRQWEAENGYYNSAFYALKKKYEEQAKN